MTNKEYYERAIKDLKELRERQTIEQRWEQGTDYLIICYEAALANIEAGEIAVVEI